MQNVIKYNLFSPSISFFIIFEQKPLTFFYNLFNYFSHEQTSNLTDSGRHDDTLRIM